jgi:hypothetical protein
MNITFGSAPPRKSMSSPPENVWLCLSIHEDHE